MKTLYRTAILVLLYFIYLNVLAMNVTLAVVNHLSPFPFLSLTVLGALVLTIGAIAADKAE